MLVQTTMPSTLSALDVIYSTYLLACYLSPDCIYMECAVAACMGRALMHCVA